MFAAFGNHVKKGLEVNLNVDGFRVQDRSGRKLEADDQGCINLGGVLKVIGGYGRDVSFSVEHKGQMLFKKGFQIGKRELRAVSTVPDCCAAGTQLEKISFEIIDSEGTLDETLHDDPNYETWNIINIARTEGRLFTKLKWPKDVELRAQVKRLHSLLIIKDSAANIPRNLEARRRLQFFTNSLFMKMPAAKPVRKMVSFSIFTPYYSEFVLYCMADLLKKNVDGISVSLYLQKIFPDEWRNFLARIGRDENALDSELFDNPNGILELQFWASYRGQTLARTSNLVF